MCVPYNIQTVDVPQVWHALACWAYLVCICRQQVVQPLVDDATPHTHKSQFSFVQSEHIHARECSLGLEVRGLQQTGSGQERHDSL